MRMMSFDLGFWYSGTGTAQEIYNDICEGDDHRLVASANVAQFRSDLLDRWISFSDFAEPLECNPETGEQANLDRYVLLTVPYSLVDELSEVVKLARHHGLTIYNPQSGEVLPA